MGMDPNMYRVGDKVKSIVSGYYLDAEGTITKQISENYYEVSLDNGLVVEFDGYNLKRV